MSKVSQNSNNKKDNCENAKNNSHKDQSTVSSKICHFELSNWNEEFGRIRAMIRKKRKLELFLILERYF